MWDRLSNHTWGGLSSHMWGGLSSHMWGGLSSLPNASGASLIIKLPFKTFMAARSLKIKKIVLTGSVLSQ